jgi:hypothetical protein
VSKHSLPIFPKTAALEMDNSKDGFAVKPLFLQQVPPFDRKEPRPEAGFFAGSLLHPDGRSFPQRITLDMKDRYSYTSHRREEVLN